MKTQIFLKMNYDLKAHPRPLYAKNFLAQSFMGRFWSKFVWILISWRHIFTLRSSDLTTFVTFVLIDNFRPCFYLFFTPFNSLLYSDNFFIINICIKSFLLATTNNKYFHITFGSYLILYKLSKIKNSRGCAKAIWPLTSWCYTLKLYQLELKAE